MRPATASRWLPGAIHFTRRITPSSIHGLTRNPPPENICSIEKSLNCDKLVTAVSFESHKGDAMTEASHTDTLEALPAEELRLDFFSDHAGAVAHRLHQPWVLVQTAERTTEAVQEASYVRCQCDCACK